MGQVVYFLISGQFYKILIIDMAANRPTLNFGLGNSDNNAPPSPHRQLLLKKMTDITGALDSSFIYNPSELSDETIAYICDDKNIVEYIYNNSAGPFVEAANYTTIVNKSRGIDGELYIVKWNTKEVLQFLDEQTKNYKKYMKMLEEGFDFVIPLLYAKTNYKKKGDTYYNVMITRYIPGQTLEKFPANSLDHEQIRNIINQLVRCLQSLSSRGFVHRDIKPENIFIHISDAEFKVYLIDFDTVCNMEAEEKGEIFMTCRLFPDETIKGTRSYARPNSTLNVRKRANYIYTSKNDLYSLGIVIRDTLSRISKDKKADLTAYGEAMMLENLKGGRRKTNRRKYKSLKRRKTIKRRY